MGNWKNSFFKICISAGFFLIAIGFAATVFLYRSHNKINNEAITETKNLSLTLEKYVDSVFDKVEDLLLFEQKLYSVEKIKSISPQKISLELAKLIEKHEEIELISFIDETGHYLSNSYWSKDNSLAEKQKNVSLFERSYFKEHLNSKNDKLIISEPVQSKTTGNSVIVLSRKLDPENSLFKGIILITINIDFISQYFAKLNTGEKGSLSLFSEKRQLLARFPIDPKIIGKVFLKPQTMINEVIMNKINGTFRDKSVVDGEERIFSYYFLKDYPVHVVIGKSVQEINKIWYHYLYLILTLIFTMATFSLIYFIFSYRLLIKMDEQNLNITISEKMASLGELSSSIAHEIKNPMTIIKGRIQQINNQINKGGDINPEKLKSSIDSINKAGDKILSIIKSIQSFSRNSANDSMTATELKEILTNVYELVDDKIVTQNIQFEINDKSSAKINCRESEITQVLVNLVNNAIDAVSANESKWIHVRTESELDKVKIIVTDSGKGIPLEIQKKIMQPFFTTKSVGKGTGLGLSISKKIIDNHQGKFYIDTTSANTSFVIELQKITQESISEKVS